MGYAQFKISSVFSANADLSSPESEAAETVDKSSMGQVSEGSITATTGGKTITISHFGASTPPMALLANIDTNTSNTITVTYKTVSGSSTVQTIMLLAGSACLLPDLATATAITLTCSTANATVRYFIVGA